MRCVYIGELEINLFYYLGFRKKNILEYVLKLC